MLLSRVICHQGSNLHVSEIIKRETISRNLNLSYFNCIKLENCFINTVAAFGIHCSVFYSYERDLINDSVS
jgi:hypothetical protein